MIASDGLTVAHVRRSNDGHSVVLDVDVDTRPFVRGMTRLAIASELAADVMTEMGTVLAGGVPKSNVVYQAGLEARFYIRGALAPRFADQAAADTYAQCLVRANVGAAVAFMRGQAERRPGRPPLSHTHRSWGTSVVQVVTR